MTEPPWLHRAKCTTHGGNRGATSIQYAQMGFSASVIYQMELQTWSELASSHVVDLTRCKRQKSGGKKTKHLIRQRANWEMGTHL